MLVSIERKVRHLQRLAQLSCLLFVLAAMVMPFHASMAADTPSSPRAAGAIVRHGQVTVESAKIKATPTSCLLAFGNAPQNMTLLPGISKRMVNPDAVRVADASAKARTWSAPSLYEPEFMLHYVEIFSSRFQVRGVYLNTPPYHIEALVLRDATVTLPCGLRVGQPLDQFTRILGQSTESGSDGEIEYDWQEYTHEGAVNWGANVLLRFGPKRTVQEIQWEYAVD